MKDMKFRIRDAKHSAEVQKALFANGYRWPISGQEVSNTEYPSLYVYKDLRIYYDFSENGENYFENHPNPEYAVFEGKLVNVKEYFVQPETPMKPAAKRPPLGLRPRSTHDNERAQEVLVAMLRYVEAGMDVPKEWAEELVELINRQEKQ